MIPSPGVLARNFVLWRISVKPEGLLLDTVATTGWSKELSDSNPEHPSCMAETIV